MIYIQEAHAVDTWPLGLPPAQQLTSTHTLAARIRNAQQLLAHEGPLPWEIYVDVPPRAAFNATFASWPLRFWVLDVLPEEAETETEDQKKRNDQARVSQPASVRQQPRVRVSFLSQPEGDIIDVPQVERYLQARYGCPNSEN